MAVLCTTVLGTGALCIRHPGRRPPVAIRATAPAGMAASPPALAAASPAPPPTVSLYQLARELRARGTTASTATTTTVARPAASPPPPTSTTTTTTAPAPVPAKSASPSTTTTTTPLTPLTTLLQAIAPATAAVFGQASWFHAPDGTCAHRDLPLGTVVKVMRPSTGASTTCRVNDRGPTLATNRVIDLSLDTFEKLASRDAGIIDVRIEW